MNKKKLTQQLYGERRRKMEKIGKILFYQNVKSGERVDSGFSGVYLTAPDHGDGATYTLYEKVYMSHNTHAGWLWKKKEEKNE